jgi:hypothetical protein
MLHLRKQNLVSGFDIPGTPGGGDKIDPLGRAAREDDFICAPRIDELRGTPASSFVCGCSAIAQLVNPAMDVCVIPFVVVPQRVNDCAWFLRRRRIIEINERLPMDFLVKDWEIASKASPIYPGLWLFCGVSNHRFELQAENRLKQAQLQFGRFGHHPLVPGRIPNQFHIHIIDAFE